MKEQNSIKQFKTQMQEKRRLYEAESDQNWDIYIESLAQHIIYSYQANLHQEIQNEQAPYLESSEE